jgi:2-isopropylmalate synthase
MLNIGLMVTQDSTYALRTLEVAIAAGAEWIVLCDTNGGTLPYEVSKVVRMVAQSFNINRSFQEDEATKTLTTPKLGIHAHNDSDTAVANSLAAVIGGAYGSRYHQRLR